MRREGLSRWFTDERSLSPTSTTNARLFNLACAILATALTVLVFVAFDPLSPRSDLDSSWKYALDAASADRLAFGRTIVFTFGPLVSLYSGFRVPSHDLFYLMSAIIVACAIALAFILATVPRRRPYLLLLPLIIANLLAKDAIFFVMPLALLVGCNRLTPPARLVGASLAVVAAVIGALPLIKGTMSIPVAVCIVLTAILLLRRRSGLGIAIPAIVALALPIAWVSCGQRITDLPAYFRNQAYVASGYTDAMSIFGDTASIYLYLAAAIALCGLAMQSIREIRVISGIAFFSVTFVAFKAGFVRQDVHVDIAGSTLALIGYLIFLQDARRIAIVAPLLGFGSWALLAAHYVAVDPATDFRRFVATIDGSIHGIVTRVDAPDQLFTSFAAAKGRIRTEAALFPAIGFADLYPFELSSLLASDILWNPRPVIQSYSAYTPELAAMNAHHFAGANPPETLYFMISTIDNRYLRNPLIFEHPYCVRV